MSNSVQDKLKRVRPPRVKISYDVETGGAQQTKELPFVGALIADLAGDNKEGQSPYNKRKFIEIDNDTVGDVMAAINPTVSFAVDNKLSGQGDNINVSLSFNELSDFSPESIIQQVEPLRKLFEARSRLNDLAAKLDGNDELDNLLYQVIANTDAREDIKGALSKAPSPAAVSAATDDVSDGDAKPKK
jgi:type VI secretion system protein ImpB